eukprot:TRINITY_DN25372_c0_g1_i1.p1 TRINITY_DN25372_c0_g1~~TRINITY_DN25372_c0_g1_i1.p1  ORF type:complete len:677 (+),score=132.50 TRINITY_DN25372_c0_g1_i1:21-2051(+)
MFQKLSLLLLFLAVCSIASAIQTLGEVNFFTTKSPLIAPAASLPLATTITISNLLTNAQLTIAQSIALKHRIMTVTVTGQTGETTTHTLSPSDSYQVPVTVKSTPFTFSIGISLQFNYTTCSYAVAGQNTPHVLYATPATYCPSITVGSDTIDGSQDIPDLSFAVDVFQGKNAAYSTIGTAYAVDCPASTLVSSCTGTTAYPSFAKGSIKNTVSGDDQRTCTGNSVFLYKYACNRLKVESLEVIFNPEILKPIITYPPNGAILPYSPGQTITSLFQIFSPTAYLKLSYGTTLGTQIPISNDTYEYPLTPGVNQENTLIIKSESGATSFSEQSVFSTCYPYLSVDKMVNLYANTTTIQPVLSWKTLNFVTDGCFSARYFVTGVSKTAAQAKQYCNQYGGYLIWDMESCVSQNADIASVLENDGTFLSIEKTGTTFSYTDLFPGVSAVGSVPSNIPSDACSVVHETIYQTFTTPSTNSACTSSIPLVCAFPFPDYCGAWSTNIYLKKGSGAYYLIGTVAYSVTSFQIPTRVSTGTYYFKVETTNGFGNSTFSDEYSFTVACIDASPSVPVFLSPENSETIFLTANNSFTVSWAAVTDFGVVCSPGQLVGTTTLTCGDQVVDVTSLPCSSGICSYQFNNVAPLSGFFCTLKASNGVQSSTGVLSFNLEQTNVSVLKSEL